jgi:hypothetical protein
MVAFDPTGNAVETGEAKQASQARQSSQTEQTLAAGNETEEAQR